MTVPKPDKRKLLKARGWERLISYGAETWTHKRYGPDKFYSLAATYIRETAG